MAQINIKKNTSASVSTPPAGVQALFIGTDSILYGKSDAGAVTQLAGLTGPAGSAGSSGTSGVSGSSGSSGTSGVNGNSGSSGTSGVNGNNGSSGTSGVNGATGSSGTSGVNGSSGTSGQGGSSGTSGTSPAGGGAAGLIAGVGAFSIQSNPTLTPGATATGEYAISIGATVSGATNSITIGKNITNNAVSSVYIGKDFAAATTFDSNSVMIGDAVYNTNSAETTVGSVVIGWNAGISGFGISSHNVCVGEEARALQFNESSVAVGYLANTGRLWSVAIGRGANTGGGDSAVAIGAGANATAGTSLAIMRDSNSSGDSTIAIGSNAAASAQYSVAIGKTPTATHANSVVLGTTMSSIVESHTHVRNLVISNPPVYADNAAALSGGLTASQVYRTSTGVLMITY